MRNVAVNDSVAGVDRLSLNALNSGAVPSFVACVDDEYGNRVHMINLALKVNSSRECADLTP